MEERKFRERALKIDRFFGVVHSLDNEDCECYECIKARTELEEVLEHHT